MRSKNLPASTETTVIGSMSELSLSDWFDNRYEISRSSVSAVGYMTSTHCQPKDVLYISQAMGLPVLLSGYCVDLNASLTALTSCCHPTSESATSFDIDSIGHSYRRQVPRIRNFCVAVVFRVLPNLSKLITLTIPLHIPESGSVLLSPQGPPHSPSA